MLPERDYARPKDGKKTIVTIWKKDLYFFAVVRLLQRRKATQCIPVVGTRRASVSQRASGGLHQ